MGSVNIDQTVLSYLRGELSVEDAADTIFRLQKAGGGFSLSPTDLPSLEKSEALMGRLLWLTLREIDPNSAPTTQSGSAAFREFQRQAQAECKDPGAE
jgi:hypothetical protein